MQILLTIVLIFFIGFSEEVKDASVFDNDLSTQSLEQQVYDLIMNLEYKKFNDELAITVNLCIKIHLRSKLPPRLDLPKALEKQVRMFETAGLSVSNSLHNAINLIARMEENTRSKQEWKDMNMILKRTAENTDKIVKGIVDRVKVIKEIVEDKTKDVESSQVHDMVSEMMRLKDTNTLNTDTKEMLKFFKRIN